MSQDLALRQKALICVDDQLVQADNHTNSCLVPPNAALNALELTIVETRVIQDELVLACTTPHNKGYQSHAFSLVAGKEALGHLNAKEQALATIALHWSQWQRTVLFCEVCKGSLLADSVAMVKDCLSCGKTHYPTLKPAIIALIHDGPRVLLARSPHHVQGLYSLIAGFPETGESLEDAVIREVREETGLAIDHPVYRYSQSWPFPDRLMMAFTAQYQGGKILRQEEELEDLAWFSIDNLPQLPYRASVAYRLIDDYRNHWCQSTA